MLTKGSWTLEHGRRRITTDGVIRDYGRAHGAYQTVTPDEIAPKLERAGYVVDVQQGKYTGFGQAVMNVYGDQTPLEGGQYRAECRILFDHKGTSSVKLCAGVSRLICENQFTAPLMALHHCHNEIREFLEHPERYVELAIQNTARLADGIERLHRFDQHAAARLGAMRTVHGLRLSSPRLAGAVMKHLAPNSPLEGTERRGKRMYPVTPWGVLQAATETKRAGLLRLANSWLGGQALKALCDVNEPCPLDMFEPKDFSWN